MTDSPTDIVKAILAAPTDRNLVHRLMAADATYVSLNYDNPELKAIMPWAGTHTGSDALVDTYQQVGRYWTNEAFEIETIVASGEDVAVFGRFTYRSVTLGKAITSPFAILAKVRGGQVAYMQFMEDTYGTASTFRTGGAAFFLADPDGGTVEL